MARQTTSAARWWVAGAAAVLVLLARTAFTRAQQVQPSREPHVGYVVPAGGKVGTTFDVTVGGQRLAGVRAVHVSGAAGVRAEVLEHLTPLSPKDALLLRDELKKLTEKQSAAKEAATRPASTAPAWTPADERRVAEIKAALARYNPRPASPAIVEQVRLRVTIASHAEPGDRELRLLCNGGLTNPLVFQVNTLSEFREDGAADSKSGTETSVTLPCVVNGQVLAGDIDRFRFAARRGQNLVVIVAARRLVPYLADAVPGWFQPTLALYDAHGNELAYADDWRFDPDPVLRHVIPADGEYVLEIKDSIYRGREDFVYRVAVGDLPFITGVFPPGGRAGERTEVELRGWNLPVGRTVVEAADEPGVRPLFVTKRGVRSNVVPFAIDDLPETVEPASPTTRPVTMPVVVNGRIEQADDVDAYAFEGHAGERFVAEVNARRLGSPLDAGLSLHDGSGATVAANDDAEDKGAGLHTHHADARIATTLPSDGTYELRVRDAARAGGSEFAYRLRLGAPQPNFELRVVPSAVNLRAVNSSAVTVYAVRRDGFDGAIDLSLVDPPAGFKIGKARIAAGAEQVRVTLAAPTKRTDEPVALRLVGRARIGGADVTRSAVPADDMMQAFAYRHLVCAKEWLATVRRATPAPATRPRS